MSSDDVVINHILYSFTHPEEIVNGNYQDLYYELMMIQSAHKHHVRHMVDSGPISHMRIRVIKPSKFEFTCQWYAVDMYRGYCGFGNIFNQTILKAVSQRLHVLVDEKMKLVLAYTKELLELCSHIRPTHQNKFEFNVKIDQVYLHISNYEGCINIQSTFKGTCTFQYVGVKLGTIQNMIRDVTYTLVDCFVGFDYYHIWNHEEMSKKLAQLHPVVLSLTNIPICISTLVYSYITDPPSVKRI